MREKAAVKAGDKTVSGQACVRDYREVLPGERDVLFRMKSFGFIWAFCLPILKICKRLRKHSACAIMRKLSELFSGNRNWQKTVHSVHPYKRSAVIRAGQIYPNKDMSVRPYEILTVWKA